MAGVVVGTVPGCVTWFTCPGAFVMGGNELSGGWIEVLGILLEIGTRWTVFEPGNMLPLLRVFQGMLVRVFQGEFVRVFQGELVWSPRSPGGGI